jgi:Leucine-rich repeat (LRR) protein
MSGVLPASIVKLSQLQYLLLAGNQLTGLLPDLTALTRLSYLITVRCAANSFLLV